MTYKEFITVWFYIAIVICSRLLYLSNNEGVIKHYLCKQVSNYITMVILVLICLIFCCVFSWLSIRLFALPLISIFQMCILDYLIVFRWLKNMTYSSGKHSSQLLNKQT
jgi:hypothetical protein